MLRKLTFASIWLLVSVASACGSSPSANAGSPSPSASPSSSSSASAKAVSYDPCVLVTAQEASTLTGLNYTAGLEQGDTEKRCVYGYQTTDVLMVGIVQAPDIATVQADEAQARAALQQQAGQGLNFAELHGFGDAAAVIQASQSANGTTLALCGIYVVKGTIFFFITDVAANHAVPSNSALEDAAMKVLSQL